MTSCRGCREYVSTSVHDDVETAMSLFAMMSQGTPRYFVLRSNFSMVAQLYPPNSFYPQPKISYLRGILHGASSVRRTVGRQLIVCCPPAMVVSLRHASVTVIHSASLCPTALAGNTAPRTPVKAECVDQFDAKYVSQVCLTPNTKVRSRGVALCCAQPCKTQQQDSLTAWGVAQCFTRAVRVRGLGSQGAGYCSERAKNLCQVSGFKINCQKTCNACRAAAEPSFDPLHPAAPACEDAYDKSNGKG